MRSYFSSLIHGGGWFPVVASAAALSGALLSQYGFGMHPCELCLLQRWPYALALALGLAVPFTGRWMLFVLAALLAASAGLGAYHVGVEHHWWTFGTGCSGPAAGGSVDDLRATILSAPLVRCDEPAFVFLGLSMAGWNVLYGLAAAALTLRLTRKRP